MAHDSALASRVSQQQQIIRSLRREVAGLRRATEAAQQTAGCYRTVLDSLGVGFCLVQMIVDDDGNPIDYRFQDANVAFEQQSGLMNVVGKTPRELAPGGEPDSMEIYGEVALTGEPRRFEHTAGKDGRHYDVYAFRTGAPQQRTVGVLFSDRSVWERAEAAEREAATLKDHFLATLAHELRNPLAPLQSGLDVLRMTHHEPTEDGSAEYQMLEIMARQLGHLTHLMDELLDVSQINRGVVTLERRQVDLVEVIHEGAEAAAAFIHAGGRRFSADLPAEPLPVEGDPARLVQVVTNLLENAGKFTSDEGCIQVTARRQAGMAQVTVADDGLGIEADMLEEIFGMFRQTSTDRQGLGLGLTLVRDLVRLHGGTVEAHSEGRGRGSEFIVEIPLSRASVPAPQTRASRRLPALERQRMLVVDDNHDAADSLAVLLKSMGAEVKTAYDGRTALSLLDELQPHIVFLDIGMPEMDGYEVARLMRSRNAGADLLLVAITGWGQPADRRRAAEAGFDDHLVKPATIDDLRSVVAANQEVR